MSQSIYLWLPTICLLLIASDFEADDVLVYKNHEASGLMLIS